MTNDKWKDQDIEELLEQAPKIHDTRSKDEVLLRLKQEHTFDEKTNQKNIYKKKSSSFTFYAASVALVFLTFMGAYLLATVNNNQKDETSIPSMDQAAEFKTTEEHTESGDVGIMRTLGTEDLRTAVYAEDISDVTVFPMGLVLGDDSVPITFLIPNEQIASDFEEEPTQLQLYEKYAPLIDEKNLGFDDFHPYRGRLVASDSTLTHVMPKNHAYDLTSSTMSVYNATLKDTFGKDYSALMNENEDGEPVTIDQAGEASKPSQLGDEMLRFSYALYNSQDGSVYLAPNNRETFDSVTEALLQMPLENKDVKQSAIIEGITYKVEEQEEYVTIRFNEPFDLEGHDAQQTMRMIEAILLTAAGFNQQVQFENIVQTNWGGFEFLKPLPIPIGANKVHLESILNN